MRKQGLALGVSQEFLGVVAWGVLHPSSPDDGWAWVPPVGLVVEVAEALALSRVQQLLELGSSAPTSCVCAFPRGPYIRHKLFPLLMFDFLLRISGRPQGVCCGPIKPSFPQRAASAKVGSVMGLSLAWLLAGQRDG